MQPNRLQNALRALQRAITEAQEALEEAKSEPDPLATHIFVSRRHIRNMPDTKSGKRSDMAIRFSWILPASLVFGEVWANGAD